MLRISEAAKRLGLHPDTLRRLERRGIVTFARDWAGNRRISEAKVEELRDRLFQRPHDTGVEAGRDV